MAPSSSSTSKSSATSRALQLAENRLKEFKLKHMGVPGQSGQAGQDFFGKMAKLGDDIANARLELRAAEESRDRTNGSWPGRRRPCCLSDLDPLRPPPLRKSTRESQR